MTTTEIVRKPVLLGPDGEPWYGTPGDDDGQQLKSQAVVRSFTSFLHALSSLDASPSFRSREPFANHAWVYAVASAFAMNIAQAPLQVVRETDTSTADRKGRVLRQGLKWTGVPRGTQRRAVERHLETQSRLRGAVMRGVEPFLEHPFMTPLTHPNYLMTGRRSLIIATVVWLCIRGECDWILLSATGDPLAYDEDATEVWPVNPDALTPSIVDNRLVGWWFNVPTGMGLRSRGRQLFLQPKRKPTTSLMIPMDHSANYSVD